MSRRTAKLVTFGNGGDTVYFSAYCKCQGYGSPERPHAAQLSEDCIIPDGTPAIDKRAAVETDDGFRWAFQGPMVNVDLPENVVDCCPMPSPVFAAAMAETPGFGSMLASQFVHGFGQETAGPLDSVSIGEYVNGWRDHGARIGYYKNGVIVWEDDKQPS